MPYTINNNYNVVVPIKDLDRARKLEAIILNLFPNSFPSLSPRGTMTEPESTIVLNVHGLRLQHELALEEASAWSRSRPIFDLANTNSVVISDVNGNLHVFERTTSIRNAEVKE